MQIVKKQTVCEVCGDFFDGEFVQHEKLEDDYPWETLPNYESDIDEDGIEIINIEVPEERVYPHLHEQPTAECHICPDCRVR